MQESWGDQFQGLQFEQKFSHGNFRSFCGCMLAESGLIRHHHDITVLLMRMHSVVCLQTLEWYFALKYKDHIIVICYQGSAAEAKHRSYFYNGTLNFFSSSLPQLYNSVRETKLKLKELWRQSGCPKLCNAIIMTKKYLELAIVNRVWRRIEAVDKPFEMKISSNEQKLSTKERYFRVVYGQIKDSNGWNIAIKSALLL